MNPKNPQMVATTNQAPRALDVPPLNGSFQITLHFDTRFNFGSLFVCPTCAVYATLHRSVRFSEHLLFSQPKVLQSSRTILSFS